MGRAVTAVIQVNPEHDVSATEITAFVKARIGSVKTPKQVEVWPDLPRSKVGKVLKADNRAALPARTQPPAPPDAHGRSRD